jgi:hypothetical protein
MPKHVVGSRYASLRVRWVEHASASAIVRSYRNGIARAAKVKARDLMGMDEMAEQIAALDIWAYCDSLPKTPVIHYRFTFAVTTEEISFMLGHEVGHLSGKTVRSAWAEEDRADTYGRAVVTVMRKLGL